MPDIKLIVEDCAVRQDGEVAGIDLWLSPSLSFRGNNLNLPMRFVEDARCERFAVHICEADEATCLSAILIRLRPSSMLTCL
jgi:hypothetical protein